MKRELKFCALFKHIATGKTIWLESTVNHTIKDIGGYLQLTEWLQYTDQKDRNGKGIYDGDIAKLSNGEIGSISYFNGRGFYFSSKRQSSVLWELLNFYKIEVIGNIYENPELLK